MNDGILIVYTYSIVYTEKLYYFNEDIGNTSEILSESTNYGSRISYGQLPLLYNAFLFDNSISFRQIVSRIIVKQRRQEVISRHNAACSCQKRIPTMQMNLNGDHQWPNSFDLPQELQFSCERLGPRGNSICTSDFTGYRHESGSILSNRPIL